MNKLSVAIAVAAMAIGIGGAAAQTYPSRPITMIAPFPAGGPSDALARILSEPIRAALAGREPGRAARTALGPPATIECAARAGGNMGVGRLARASLDSEQRGRFRRATARDNAVTYTPPYDVL